MADSVGTVVVKHASSDGKRVVLPDAPCQGREVEVCMPFTSDAGDVKADVILVDNRDVSFANPVASQANEPVQSVKGPEGEGNVHPQLIAPLLREPQ